MRVECSSCKRLTEGEFKLADGGSLAVTCTTCGCTTSTVLNPGRGKPSSTIPIDKLCPKCGTTRLANAESCRSCGISTTRMQGYAEERDAAIPDDVRAEWDAAVGAWNDPARHDALLLSVARNGCYAWAAGRYRDAVVSRPHDPIAPRQLERLRRAGEATLFATATARPDKAQTPYIAVIGILAIMLIAIVGGVIYANAKTKDAEPATRIEVR